MADTDNTYSFGGSLDDLLNNLKDGDKIGYKKFTSTIEDAIDNGVKKQDIINTLTSDKYKGVLYGDDNKLSDKLNDMIKEYDDDYEKFVKGTYKEIKNGIEDATPSKNGIIKNLWYATNDFEEGIAAGINKARDYKGKNSVTVHLSDMSSKDPKIGITKGKKFSGFYSLSDVGINTKKFTEAYKKANTYMRVGTGAGAAVGMFIGGELDDESSFGTIAGAAIGSVAGSRIGKSFIGEEAESAIKTAGKIAGKTLGQGTSGVSAKGAKKLLAFLNRL